MSALDANVGFPYSNVLHTEDISSLGKKILREADDG